MVMKTIIITQTLTSSVFTAFFNLPFPVKRFNIQSQYNDIDDTGLFLLRCNALSTSDNGVLCPIVNNVFMSNVINFEFTETKIISQFLEFNIVTSDTEPVLNSSRTGNLVLYFNFFSE
jgi:hypothetical protein